jgi:hypothetical protein
MRNGNRLIVGAVGMFALAVLAYGCQVRDGFFPTEAQRSIQPSVTASEVFAKINEVITDPTLGKSATSQFQTIVKLCPKKPLECQARAESEVDFILKHFAEGKWEDADGTGELVALILEFVGLIPEAQGATTCIPGVDCQGEATHNNEFAGAKIPGDLVDVPFVLLFTPLPDMEVKPPLFGLIYDISTFPEGITFSNSSPSGSLTLSSEDDQPVAGVCTLGPDDPEGVPEGVHPDSLYVVHFENGVWERLEQVDITFLDCSTASSETESVSLWSSPILKPVLEFLSPGRVVAAGTRTGGAITSFSPHATEVAGTIPTTTTLSIVEGQNTFFSGETITLRAEVNPEPTGGNVAFFATNPVSGPGAPIVAVVDGVATQTFVCGSDRVPFGSHTAQVQYLGSGDFSGSVSTTIPYECLEGSGD